MPTDPRAVNEAPIASAEAVASQPGDVARYRNEGEIARGGMGAIFKAYDRVRAQHVALKRPRTDGAAELNARNVAMLEREYRVLANLKHPRIVEVYEYRVDEQGPYYTMEWLEGSDLRARTPVPWRELCSYLRDVASSLALLHARRLAHRDVTPLNIRITSEGRAKLLDFGALVDFGLPENIVGTPSHIAPEMLRGERVDQRTDIFALGATAYYSLSGNAAYPAASIAQLPAVWQRGAPAGLSLPSADVPKELEALIISMLDLDPSSRPSSAAEVIDRLNAIASLDSDDDERVLLSYLRNPRLVGRDQARIKAIGEYKRSLHGSCTSVLIEGATGMGKSALMNEVCQEARIAGSLVLHVQGLAHRVSSLSTCAALFAQTDAEASELAARTLDRQGLRFDHDRLSLAPHAAGVSSDAQVNYLNVFVAMAQTRPLVLAVDDADHADARSMLVLNELAKTKTRILLLLTARADTLGEQVAMRALRRVAHRIPLEGLNEREIVELAHAWFGEVSAVPRLASWLSQQTAGNPALCAEQVAELVIGKHIRYMEGAWQLPDEFSGYRPASRARTLLRRADMLRPATQRVASCLSVQRTAASEAVLRSIVSSHANVSTSEIAAALEELEHERIVLRAGGHVVFASEDLRTLFLARLEPALRTSLHRQLAGLFLAEITDNPARECEVAQHLLAAGDEAAAAKHLRRAVSRGARQAGALVEMVPDFYAIYDEYERMQLPATECLLATLPLVIAGVYVDPNRTQAPFGETVVRHLRDCTGMTVAERLRRFIGAPLAFIVGLLCSLFLYMRLDARRRFARWLDYPIAFYGASSALSASAAMRCDYKVYDYLLPLLAHAEGLAQWQSARNVYEIVATGPLFAQGRIAPAVATLRRILGNLPRVLDLDTPSRLQFEHGIRFYIGRWSVYLATAEPLSHAEILCASGAAHDEIQGEYLRYSYYLNRGETAAALNHRRRIDELSAEHGGHWLPDLVSALELSACHGAADIVAIKAQIEQLESAVIKHPGHKPAYEVARALYAGHRGRPEHAIQMYEQLAATLTPFSHPVWPVAYSHWAECLNAVGRHGEALELTGSALMLLTPQDCEYVLLYQQLEREQAIALAALGFATKAAQQLDALLERLADCDHPLLLGLLHRDRARVALLARDEATFGAQLTLASEHLRSTKNAALVALARQLVALGHKRNLAMNNEASGVDTGSEVQPFGLESHSHTAGDVARLITDHVVQTLGASRARLYLIQAGEPQLCAASGDERWVESLEDTVIRALRMLQDAENDVTVADQAPASSGATDAEMPRLLVLRQGDAGVVAILAVSDCPGIGALRPRELAHYARALARSEAQSADPRGELTRRKS